MVNRVIAVVGLAVVLLAAALWICFPLYRTPSGSYVHRPVWAPVELPIGHGYDLLTPEDIERLSKDPEQRRILEGMKNLPRSYPSTPIWIGNRHGPPKNYLFAATTLLAAVYIAALKLRGVF